MADSNSFLRPWEILPVAQDKRKHLLLQVFSIFVFVCVFCCYCFVCMCVCVCGGGGGGVGVVFFFLIYHDKVCLCAR